MSNQHGVEASAVCDHPNTLCFECPDVNTCEFSGEVTHGPVIHIAPPPAPEAPPAPALRVLVTGSRSHWEYDLAAYFVQQILDTYPRRDTIFISGGAGGADSLMHHILSEKYGRKTEQYKVTAEDWEILKGAAGFARNWKMVLRCDQVAALWDGESKGTQHTIEIARRMGKPVMCLTIPSTPNPNPQYRR